MEIRALRYFQTVAMCGSYSRGSELLHISQPAVSRMIRNLEEEIGTALFRRHGHGVSLTDAGQLLLERSQGLLRQLEQTKAEVRGGKASPSGIISFAIPPAAGCILVPTLVSASVPRSRTSRSTSRADSAGTSTNGWFAVKSISPAYTIPCRSAASTSRR